MIATDAEGAPVHDPERDLRCGACGAPLSDDSAGTGEAARCPSCGEPIKEATEDDDERPVRAPWHFKVLVLGTVGYLIYRFIWFIGWLTHHV